MTCPHCKTKLHDVVDTRIKGESIVRVTLLGFWVEVILETGQNIPPTSKWTLFCLLTKKVKT